ncbi:hypothetical protein JD844_020497 [Phrynosoma platyrhinos]|uniref:Maestro heat-like repeat family member 5 n=1 Tax=Phrynosoma platyrhinos TaxID=52577 RepID=A0ABQ7SSN0_PHRPL|nr:hypothetical protein JD844_020497 [Phrynosoma platyrhinos]
MKLLESFQDRLLPYHSILKVLGKLANKAFSESDAAKIGIWERKMVEGGGHPLILPQVFLYQYYGFILRASNDSQLVQEHLHTILALAHRGPLEAKGIASALGLAASHHLQEVINVLESFSVKISKKEKSLLDGSQRPPWDTLLLCYGRVALGIAEELLPRADTIMSKMITFFTANPLDMNLKKTFLVAVLMLLEAVAATGKAQCLRLCMKGPLVECLTVILQDTASNLVMVSLTKDAKNGIQGVLHCQTMDEFKGMLQGLILEDPYKCDLVHMVELMEPWIASELDHVRERAVDSVTMLLKFLASHLNMDGPEDPLFSVQLTSLVLASLDSLQGSDRELQGASEEVLHAILQNHARKIKRVRALQPLPSPPNSCLTWQAVFHHLNSFSPAQMKEVVVAIYTCLQVHPNSYWIRKVVLKALGYLLPDHLEEVVRSCLFFSIPVNRYGCQTIFLRSSGHTSGGGWRQARELWTAMASGPQVATQILKILLKSLQVEDPQGSNEGIIIMSLAAMNVIYESFGIPGYRLALVEMHPQLFIPMLRQVCYVRQLALPKALQARQEDIMSTSVEIMKGLFSLVKDWAVYACIQFQQGWMVLGTPGQFMQGIRLLARAMTKYDSPQIPGVFSEAMFILSTEKDEMKKMTALALVVEESCPTQLQAVGSQVGVLLGVRETPLAQSSADAPSFLLSTWATPFTCLAVALPAKPPAFLMPPSSHTNTHTYTHTAASLTPQFLKSPSAIQIMDRCTLKQCLEEEATSSSPAIKDLCLKALRSFIFEPGEVKRLRDQLPVLMESVFSGQEQDVLKGLEDLMATLQDLDGQGIGDLTLELAMNVRSFFEDERASVRCRAFALFGHLVMRALDVDEVLLKKEVVFSLLPLLLHLMDQDSTVAMASPARAKPCSSPDPSCKLALLDCGFFLGWADLHLIFRSLAWENLQSCLSNAWKYLMRNHHECTHVFISQALEYLHHPQAKIRRAAAQFTGYTLTSYCSELSKNLEQEDIVYLRKVFIELESHPDISLVRFAKQFRTALQKLSPKQKYRCVQNRCWRVVDQGWLRPPRDLSYCQGKSKDQPEEAGSRCPLLPPQGIKSKREASNDSRGGEKHDWSREVAEQRKRQRWRIELPRLPPKPIKPSVPGGKAVEQRERQWWRLELPCLPPKPIKPSMPGGEVAEQQERQRWHAEPPHLPPKPIKPSVLGGEAAEQQERQWRHVEPPCLPPKPIKPSVLGGEAAEQQERQWQCAEPPCLPPKPIKPSVPGGEAAEQWEKQRQCAEPPRLPPKPIKLSVLGGEVVEQRKRQQSHLELAHSSLKSSKL